LLLPLRLSDRRSLRSHSLTSEPGSRLPDRETGRAMKALRYESNRRSKSTAFNPPKANELEIATPTCRSRATLGT